MRAPFSAVLRMALGAISGVVLGCALLHAQPSAAANRADWPALTEPVFRTVGESGITTTTAIVEDARGFLWAGSQSGLFRWDGYRLKTYEPDPQTAGTLPDAFIRVLLTDRRGQLWIGTMSGGLARYERDSDRFVTYAGGSAGPSSDTISALADTSDGLWIGTTRGLDFRVARTGLFTHYRHAAHNKQSLPGNTVNSLLVDHGGTLWVATNGGLARAEPGTARFVRVAFPTDGEAPVPLSVFEDRGHRVWIGTQGGGLYVVGADRRTMRQINGSGSHELSRMLKSDTIRTFGEPQPGKLWIGLNDHGILALDESTNELSFIRNEPGLPTSLSQNTIRAMYRDRAGLFWVGTLGGLSRYDAGQHTFATILISSRSLSGIASPDVTALYAPPSGPLWVGYETDGVDLLDGLRGRVGALRPNAATPSTSLPEISTQAIVGQRGGPVFIGSERGLYRAQANGSDVRRVPLATTDGNNRIATLSLAQGRLWIGTFADGVWSLDVAGRSAPAKLRGHLTDNRILTIAPTAAGRLWIGTFRGLNLVDPRSGATEHILADAADPSGIPNGFISALMIDRIGRVWVGTYGGGIASCRAAGPMGGRASNASARDRVCPTRTSTRSSPIGSAEFGPRPIMVWP